MMSPMQWLRMGLVAVALAVAAWFLVGVRATQSEERLQVVIEHGQLSPGELRAAAADVSRAGTLNPDELVNILRGEVAFHSANPASAIPIAEAVTSREPDNPDGWLLLEVVAAKHDPALVRRSELRLAQLVPPVKPAP